MSELPVPVVSPPEPPQPLTLVCANCHAPLSGEYCSACGQRHEPHIHTVVHFAGEAFESISHADSRLWRTLWYLFARPGFLTREFFAGHRVAYLPPFRLYLVLSVVFFLLTSLPSGEPAYVNPLNKDPKTAAALQEAKKELAVSGVALTEPAGATEKSGFNVHIKGFDEFCEPFSAPEKGGSGANARRNIRHFCDRVRNDASELFSELLHSLPKAMFLFLPLLAGIMKLMYWRPKRYYVEHLLFLVHNHAAVFLVLILATLLSFIPYVGDFAPLFALLYLPWYIFRAMRKMYGQHGGLTFLKYVVLGWTYIFTAFFTLLLTLIFLAILS